MIQYRFTLPPEDIRLHEIAESMVLSVVGAESLYGAIAVRLEARHTLDCQRRTCVIDADTQVGVALAKLFAGFLSKQFGDESFTVERVVN